MNPAMKGEECWHHYKNINKHSYWKNWRRENKKTMCALIQILCFWALSIVLFLLFKIHFRDWILSLQVKRTWLGPINRTSLYFQIIKIRIKTGWWLQWRLRSFNSSYILINNEHHVRTRYVVLTYNFGRSTKRLSLTPLRRIIIIKEVGQDNKLHLRQKYMCINSTHFGGTYTKLCVQIKDA
jgi:hypothetical protein